MTGKRRVTVLVVLAALVALAATPAAVAVATPPPPPAAYYGSITVNGEPARAGVTITAEIDGEIRGQLTTEQAGTYGGPGAFDPKLQVDGQNGDEETTVTFHVNGVRANETTTWESGSVERVDLTVSGAVYPSGGGDGGAGGGGSQPTQSTETPEPGEDEGNDGDDDERVVHRVNVTVNASANETVSVNLTDDSDADGDGTPDAEEGNVTIDGLDIEVERDGSFDLNVTASDDPPADDAPSLNLSDGTEALGYLRVDHTVPDEDIGGVTFQFRVKQSSLDDEGKDPANVALYRHHDGAWTELPTELVGETATHYVFEATSPGLSDFATGLKSAQFELSNAQVDVSSTIVGDTVSIEVLVENTGGADGTYQANLTVDGTVVDTRAITVAAGGTRQISFERSFEESGTYEVTINSEPAGQVSVSERATATVESELTEEDESAGFDWVGLVVFLVVAAAVVAVWHVRFR